MLVLTRQIKSRRIRLTKHLDHSFIITHYLQIYSHKYPQNFTCSPPIFFNTTFSPDPPKYFIIEANNIYYYPHNLSTEKQHYLIKKDNTICLPQANPPLPIMSNTPR